MKRFVFPAAAIGFAMLGTDAFAQTNDIYTAADVTGKIDTAVGQLGGLLGTVVGIGFGFLVVWFGFRNMKSISKTR